MLVGKNFKALRFLWLIILVSAYIGYQRCNNHCNSTELCTKLTDQSGYCLLHNHLPLSYFLPFLLSRLKPKPHLHINTSFSKFVDFGVSGRNLRVNGNFCTIHSRISTTHSKKIHFLLFHVILILLIKRGIFADETTRNISGRYINRRRTDTKRTTIHICLSL